MKEFKVGDWVRELNPLPGDNDIHQLTRSDFYGVGRKSSNYFEGIELWQPKEGEWCWFWNAQAQAPVLGKFLKYDGRLMPFFTMANDCFIFCEPFIGELPSHLKDQK